MNDRQRVLVAGAAGGIGGACVRRLTQDGHQVVGIDRDDGIDITHPEGAAAAVQRATDELDRLSGLVHAVGMSGRSLGDGPVTACSDDAWTEVRRVNLDSAFWLLRAALPHLEPGGSVVFVGSVLGRRTDPDFLTAAYATSKAALEGLTRVAAREAAARDIRVNCVLPGLVATPMAERALSQPAIVDRLAELQPLGGRAVEPEEVAGVVAWLLSEDARAVTGCCVPVDRGWMLR